jgi:hypothetical protein
MTGRSFGSPATGRSRHLADADPDRPEVGPTLSPALLARTARFRLSVALLLVVAVTSGLSLAVPTLFHDPAVTAGNLRGTCVVLLLVAVPSLAWSLRATARGSVHGLIVGMGATAYVAYDGVLLSFGAIFNRLFLLDVALLGLAAWTLAVHVPEANRAELSSMLSRRGAQWIAAYLAATVTLFGLLWLRDIVPALVSGDTPGSLAGLAMITNPVQVLDFTFTIPAGLLAAARLWQGRRASLFLAGVLLVFFTIESASVAVDQLFGHLADPAAPLTAAPVMAALTLLGLWPLTAFLYSLRPAIADNPETPTRAGTD